MIPLNEEHLHGKRKLAAIMFTDMVGYSALAQSDENLALELLEEHRRILREIFPRYSGEEIETAGDSFFVEFNSAVEAANCAIEIQTALNERNRNHPTERKIRLRIGLHIGDVVHIDSHVHGDGVNIAARLEPIATPEGICLSEDFARAVSNKISFAVIKKGEILLKNISAPMSVYCIQLPWVQEKKIDIKKPKLSAKKFIISSLILLGAAAAFYFLFFREENMMQRRIAVLPFMNIGGNDEDMYFAEGMTEQIISSLSNISGLSVIAKSSVLKYVDDVRDLEEIGNELNVGTILEGTIRKLNDKARITIQLVDVAKQENIWAMYYDKEISDIFNVQSEIAQNIASELKVQLNAEERNRIEKKTLVNIPAYNAYLYGRFYLNRRNIDGVARSIKYFEEAVMYDSSFALAYSGLADAYTLIASSGYGIMHLDDATMLANKNVMKALELDNNLAEAHASLAYIKFRLEWKFDEAEKEFKKAIELSPNYAQAHEWYALYLSLRGRYKEALEMMNRADELNPLSTSVSNGIGRIYYFMKEYKKAVAQFNKTIKMDPDYAEAHFSLALVYGVKRDFEKSIKYFNKAIQLSNRRLVIIADLAYIYGLKGDKEMVSKIKEELDQRSETEDVSPFYYVPVYAGLGDMEKAFQLMEKAVNQKFGLCLYIKADHFFDKLVSDPRHLILIERIGL